MVLDLLNIRAWAMEARFFERAFPVAYNLILSGQDLSRLKELNKEAAIFPEAYERDQNSGMLLVQASNGRKIGMIRISGGITKAGELCSYGSADYIRMIDRANASKAIDAIVIEMDTPGGSVDGTPELGQAIKESAKPVVVFADGMVASAGYWAASQSTEIMANANNYTEIGSIGTLFVYPNYANVIEAGNFPNVKIIRAPQSVDKALINSFEELTAEREKEVLTDLKQITEDFVATVKAGRGDRLQTGDEDVFTGKMYDKAIALKMGMIDAIGSRQDAIDRAGALADGHERDARASDDKKKTGPAGSGNTNKSSMKFPKISSLFGKPEAEVNEELSAEDQASLEAAEQRLTEQETELEARATRIAELQTQIESQDAQLSDLNGVIETANARIAKLEQQLNETPAGQATTVVSKADEFGDADEKYLTSVDKQKAELTEE
jgi:protease-4